jgi:hypothetical protein
MKRINARVVAIGLLTVGLFLGTAVLISVYAEGSDASSSRCTVQHNIHAGGAPHPHS